MRAAHATLERTFIFHYSLRDGHRTTIGTKPQLWLKPRNRHEFDRPAPGRNLYTGSGYEVDKRVKTIENMHMHCLVTLDDIWTTPTHNVDPNPFHHRITDPDTGKPETDLDFARKVVAYLGHRCNLYEIGNEPDLDGYMKNGSTIRHMDVRTYAERWTEFVRALRKINPNAKFIGPAISNDHGGDCTYTAGRPYPSSRPGDCYLQTFLHAVNGTDVAPNAVSFHWYPCSGAAADSCTARQWNSFATVTREVRGWIQKDLGHLVPVGITEWNFDPGSNTTLGTNPTFMIRFTQGALSSMISARLDFANQFDTQSYSGYGTLDMFDVVNHDRPKAQFTALRNVIRRYRSTRSCQRMAPGASGVAVLSNVDLPLSGTYKIFARAMVPAPGSSFVVQIDENCPVKVTDHAGVSTWDWVPSGRVSNTVGTAHTIILYGESARVKLDQLLFSRSCVPSGPGVRCAASRPTASLPIP